MAHHNKLKPCDDRFILLWIRRRRQEFLSLDDTLPYNADEHSFFNILIYLHKMIPMTMI